MDDNNKKSNVVFLEPPAADHAAGVDVGAGHGALSDPPSPAATMDGVVSQLEKRAIPPHLRPMMVDDQRSLLELREMVRALQDKLSESHKDVLGLRADAALQAAALAAKAHEAPVDQKQLKELKEQNTTLSNEMAMIARILTALPWAQEGKSLSSIVLELINMQRTLLRKLDAIDLILQPGGRK